MLSGMSVKTPAVSEKELKAFLKAGGTITVIKPKRVLRHNLKSSNRNVYRSKV